MVTAASLFHNLQVGETRHGLSDGTWSLVDALVYGAKAQQKAERSQLVLSTWTAAGADSRQLIALIKSDWLKTIRLMVDCSFQTRQPKVCELVRQIYGDDSIRVWNCHAKFAVFTGGAMDMLLLTSANLNKNKRIENFTVIADSGAASQYLKMVDDLFVMQTSGQGFVDARTGRQHTRKLQGRPTVPPWV